MGKLHVLGNNHEALIVGRKVPNKSDIAFLTQQFRRHVKLITSVKPDQSLEQVLGEIDVFKAVGDTIISTPVKEIHSIFIAFNNGWNTYHASTGRQENTPSQECRTILKEWWEGKRDPSSIADFPLSAMPADMLMKASIGIPSPELQQAIVGALDQFDVHGWETVITEAFKDGWNAARKNATRKPSEGKT